MNNQKQWVCCNLIYFYHTICLWQMLFKGQTKEDLKLLLVAISILHRALVQIPITQFWLCFKAAEKQGTAEETVQQLQSQVKDLQAELNRVRDGWEGLHWSCLIMST